MGETVTSKATESAGTAGTAGVAGTTGAVGTAVDGSVPAPRPVTTGTAGVGGSREGVGGSLRSEGAPGSGGAVGIELRNLRRTYGEVTALDGLSLTIAPGELVALLGPSGCGKTTALRALAGFERPDAGQILLGGVDITSVPANRRDMGMVFQAYSLFPNLTAADNVAFGLRLRRMPARARRARAAELLELVGLGDKARRWPHELSGGQQQRVALARALAIEPRVLLLDEPLSALDAQVRAALRDEIKSLQTRLGITTLFVTHDQEEALSLADRVGVMRSGRLEQLAAPEVIYARPATPFVARFVGTVNRLSGRLVGPGTVEVLGQRLPVLELGRTGDAAEGTGEFGGEAGVSPGAAVDVLVRPEAVVVTSVATDPVGSGTVGSGTVGSGTVGSGTVGSGSVGSGTVGSGSVGSVGAAGQVRQRTFRGAVTRVQIELSGVRTSATQAPDSGEVPDSADGLGGPAEAPEIGGVLLADVATAHAGALTPGSPVVVTLAKLPVLVTTPGG